MAGSLTAAEIAAVSLIFVVPLALTTPSAPFPSPGGGQPDSHVSLLWSPQSTHLEHVVTVVMENRVYDNYFGTYCLVRGPYCSSTGNGLPAGLCVPNNPLSISSGCTRPYNLPADGLTTSDLNHDWISGGAAWDKGAMDGFYQAEGRGSLPFGHYNGSTIPIYWDMAEEYASGDNMFAANLSYSLPNHWYLIAGQAPNVTQHSTLVDALDRSVYLHQAAATPTVQDLLNGTAVSWKYYDSNLTSWAAATSTINYVGPYSAYDYWNPMEGRSESYGPAFNSHFVPRDSFLADTANGTLPNISWLIPPPDASDHPGYNETLGQSWLAQVVDAVERSPDWSSTAIFVVWDDYGGWYDHVAPPRLLTKLLSFRSPFLVISPYAKENYIGHGFLDFFSLLRFVEWQFGVGCATPLDCNAPVPFEYFDFNQTARPPVIFPTDWLNATYPLPLQWNGGRILCPSNCQVSSSLWPNGGDMTGNFSMDT